MSETSDNTPWTLGDRYDTATALAKGGGTVEQIARGAGISEAQAKLFWGRAHPGLLDHSDGLRKTTKETPEWLLQCMKLIVETKEE